MMCTFASSRRRGYVIARTAFASPRVHLRAAARARFTPLDLRQKKGCCRI